MTKLQTEEGLPV